jgi:hypothetical protein
MVPGSICSADRKRMIPEGQISQDDLFIKSTGFVVVDNSSRRAIIEWPS